MISFKKSYAEQLFQLAIALSLLRVDPESYLGIGWESQLASSLHDGGDGWQLELRTAPVSDYPYANRKALMPLIEDLARFRDLTTNHQDVTAYLLNNIQNGETTTSSSSSNNQNQTTTVIISTNNDININNNSSQILNYDRLTEGDGNSFHNLMSDNHIYYNNENDEILNSSSIFDQNISDLNDYGESPFASFPLYNMVPVKNEPPEILMANDVLNINSEYRRERASTSFSSSGFGSVDSPQSNHSASIGSGIIDWNDYFDAKTETDDAIFLLKQEPNLDDDKDDGVSSVKSENTTVQIDSVVDIKTEIDEEEEVKVEPILDNEEEDLSPEDRDLIEVLWKQDVDLGFRLPSDEVGETKPTESNEEEIEKLKALLEVKNNEFSKDKIEDEWAGLNFTIDSETGEYIQLPPLPLDETLLDEVLQLPAFDLVTDEKDEEIIVDTKTLSPPLLSSEQNKKESEKSDDLLEPPQKEDSSIENTEPLNDSDTGGLVNLLCDMMIQPSAAAFQHPRATPNYGHHGMNSFRQSSYHHQSRVPLNRTVSMEQRWQDLANLLSLPPGMGVGMGVGDMAPPHYPSHYPHHYQAATPMSQHGQFAHHPHSVLHHNASLADLGPAQPHYGHNLGSAVSTSMHLTNSSSETDAGATGYKMEHDMMYYSSGLQTYPPAINTFGNLKNTSSELNHTNDGFLNSILNDEDLQLMDMGINDSSMYTMRLLEQNSTSNNSSVLGSASGGSNGLLSSSSMHTNLGQLGQLGGSHGDRLDASSDSAVSSMGSERVPSLSDGEWGDTGSDSAQEYHQSKYGPFDYSYHSRLGDTTRQPPVAQKKHQMFGKRYFQEQSTIPPITQQQQQPAPALAQQAEQQVPHSIKYEYDPYSMQQPPLIPHNLEGAVGPVKQLNESEIKYSCSSDFTRHSRQMQDLVSHNHSYTLPQGSGATPRPQPRDKKLKKSEDEHLTRDEKKAREHKIPMTVHDIINLPMDEFNERLSKYDLTEVQLSLIRDIRRRGKNKVAAQNCRKRKLDQILTLADEVKEVRRRKERLLSDREAALAEKKSIMDKFSTLYRHVFQYLRDPAGNPYSSAHFSLQLAADGNVFVLPRDSKADNSTHNGNHHHHNNNNNNHHQGPSHHHNHQKE